MSHRESKRKWSPEELAYCANVHPGTQAAEVEANLKNITATVRKQAGLETMAAGLWLSEAAAAEYQSVQNVQRLQQVLAQQQLRVLSLNGFPQGDFHQNVVKHNVYHPSWAEQSRLQYTISLAQTLATCLPSDADIGTISTLPLGYGQGWDNTQEQRACAHLFDYAIAAEAIEARTGKQIRLCLEMEPGCVLEKTSDVMVFFTQTLPQYAKQHQLPETLIDRYLGLCYDICHQAVMQENIPDSVRAIVAAGIVIGKVQVSSAMKVSCQANQDVLRRALDKFAEPKYLHQVTKNDSADGYFFYDDLADVLSDLPLHGHLWVHYHLPIQAQGVAIAGQDIPYLSTTNGQILEFLTVLDDLPTKPYIEIETYTWHVLPDFRPDKMPQFLIEGLLGERNWLLAQMQARDLIQ